MRPETVAVVAEPAASALIAPVIAIKDIANVVGQGVRDFAAAPLLSVAIASV
jgi:hypothetical protein